MPHKVFVYGTLKKGFGNHRRLGESPLVGKCSIPGTMYSLGPYPAITTEQPNGPVAGEIYEVTDSVLDSLDALEGHPTFYRRIKTETPLGEAWVYTMDHVNTCRDYGYPIVESGVWD